VPHRELRAQCALHGGEVGLSKIMHVEADLLDGVDDVGVGEHQVLEGPSEAPEVSQISNRRPGLGGDLKNMESKLTLSIEEPVRLMLYRDS
jgi:hypothetical protein